MLNVIFLIFQKVSNDQITYRFLGLETEISTAKLTLPELLAIIVPKMRSVPSRSLKAQFGFLDRCVPPRFFQVSSRIVFSLKIIISLAFSHRAPTIDGPYGSSHSWAIIFLGLGR